MSAQDLERGIETSHFGFGVAQQQTNLQQPMRPPTGREVTMSPSHIMHGPSYNPPASVFLDTSILAAFRYHIGIHSDPSLQAAIPAPLAQSQDGLTSRSVGDMVSSLTHSLATSKTAVPVGPSVRPASNLGIYQRVIVAERKYHREYQIFAILINGALGLQIIFAAALTALGAGNGPHNAVTAFGALNTVLAGLLTFLKGSGLPNRLKYYENEWSKLREYIEQRERDFASDTQLGRLGWDDFADEVANIERMYEGVRKDIEANTPDSYVSMSNAIKSLNSTNNNNNSHASNQANRLNRLNQNMNTADEDVRQMSRNIHGRVVSGTSDLDRRASKAWADIEKRSMVNIREAADECNDQIQGISDNIGKQADYHITTTQRVVGDGLRDAQNNAEARLSNANLAVQSRINDSQQRFNEVQNNAEARLSNANFAVQSRINESQQRFDEAQHDAETRLSNANLAVQSRVNDSQQRFNDAQHHAESKAKEMEDKLAMVAGKAAEKVLEFTKHRQR